MQEKKTFFASLTSKGAAIVGLITGFLVLCTIGFIVLGIMFLNSAVITKNNTDSAKVGTTTTNTKTTDTTVTTPTVSKKAKKPTAELFIMSYCPYGLQMQKAYLPVMELLAKKADLDIKWVNYIMHDKQEIDENNRQYCIQKEQNSNYLAYAKCFTVSGDYKTCLKTAKINESKMNSCIKSADSKFNITKNYSNKSSWLSGNYPLYNVHDDLNKKYGVQGSPTLVVNGQKVENISRNPESLKKVICSAFEKQPDECKKTLSAVSAVAGFGSGTGTDTAGADCGN
jgi:protein-disulfide isomerase